MMHTLRWQPSTLLLAIAACAALALSVALVSGTWAVALFAAPFLGALLAAPSRAAPLARAVTAPPEGTPHRVFEDETVTLEHAISLDGAGSLHVQPVPRPGLAVTTTGEPQQLTATASRWGNYPVELYCLVIAPHGLWAAECTATISRLHVYPLAAPRQIALPRVPLPDRIGTHLTRRRGSGIEFADTRAHQPGDPLHAINWKASARAGRLHINERFTDRAADIVALIDTYPHAPGPASDSLDRSVRGATQITQSALQRGDRAGITTLGSRAHWISAEQGRSQFYRIIDVVVGASTDAVDVPGTLAPLDALPPGAIAIAFSPLLESQFSLALMVLRRRGHPVVLVDVLSGTLPFEEAVEPLTAQLWRLERRKLARDLESVGVHVVTWNASEDEGADLQQAFRLLHRTTRDTGRGRRR
ncbi:DUF58 domain-containing protein [Hoyosella sp. G463]|uniref:DUF58 domain-containing protein n=1 Tax=Lolliginicoccus lacisalsi TaxID=2742202 RepID=A0A927JBL7_9ACTN|nr:DUF58 domain-containing protein [Lolliginicoccus lacisalsi]MBD8505890.1 DUF58 domain-containing protein [Lolliginicoccus lacisalsi]